MVFPRISQRIFEGYLDSLTNAPVSWVGPGVIEVSGLAPGHYVVEMPLPSGFAEKASGQGWYREIDLAGDAEVNASDGPRFATVGGSIVFDNVPHVPSEASIQLSNPETGENSGATSPIKEHLISSPTTCGQVAILWRSTTRTDFS